MIKKILKAILPPFIFSIKKSLCHRAPEVVVYSGNYNSWQDAQDDSEGYGSEIIFNKVRDAALKVKKGEFAYERDSVLFDQIEYSWPTLSCLLWSASQLGGLKVLDFGGALGSSYYQSRKFLEVLNYFQWNIVEQSRFVEYGKKNLENENLKFFYTLEECVDVNDVDIILLSSVLPYLENPYKWLSKLIALNAPFLIIDRTPFLINGDNDRITVQTVPPTICESSYPAWFFYEEKMLKVLRQKYDLVESFEALGGTVEIKNPYSLASHKGLFFARKNLINGLKKC